MTETILGADVVDVAAGVVVPLVGIILAAGLTYVTARGTRISRQRKRVRDIFDLLERVPDGAGHRADVQDLRELAWVHLGRYVRLEETNDETYQVRRAWALAAVVWLAFMSAGFAYFALDRPGSLFGRSDIAPSIIALTFFATTAAAQRTREIHESFQPSEQGDTSAGDGNPGA